MHRRRPLLVLLAWLASACASAKVAPAEAPAAPDEGPVPMSLDAHFVCGPEKMRRGEADDAILRAKRSIDEVENARAVDRENALARLHSDLATAQANHDEAERAFFVCEGRVLTTRTERFAKAETRPLRELRAIPEDERLPKEAARVRQDDARLRAALKSDRRALVAPIVSALLCSTADARQAVAEELAAAQPEGAKKKKRSKQDKALLEEIQARLQKGDALLGELKQELARESAEAAPCTDAKTVSLRACLEGKAAGEHPAACEEAAIDDHVAVWEFFGVGEKLKDSWATAL
jgi:hypothetical protein